MTKYALLAIALISISAPAFGDEGGEKKLSATLTGPTEVPGPGDPDGTGTFKGRFNAERGEICYSLTAANIQAPNAAHIHRGVKGVAGPVVVPLVAPPLNGATEACTTATTGLILEILQRPGDFYVNVHNPELPRGAVRGQLVK
jgi:hypothetical protein